MPVFGRCRPHVCGLLIKQGKCKEDRVRACMLMCVRVCLYVRMCAHACGRGFRHIFPASVLRMCDLLRTDGPGKKPDIALIRTYA